jgi:uncharacterized protein (DUF1015 family)
MNFEEWMSDDDEIVEPLNIEWTKIEYNKERATLIQMCYESTMDTLLSDQEFEDFVIEKIKTHYPDVSEEDVLDILDEVWSIYDEYLDDYSDECFDKE